MSARLLLVFAVTEFLLCLTPGPAVLLVVSQSLRSGFTSSQKGILGILVGNAIYFVLSALGLVTQLSNPKAIVFFSALLPQFLSPDGGVIAQFAVLGIVSLGIEVCVFLTYGWAAERGSRLMLKGRFSILTDRIAGGFLICAGLGLAALRRQ